MATTPYDYFRTYDHESFAVFTCQGNQPSESDIAAFEATVGFSLPKSFRTFTMSPLGSLYMEVREHLWPRPKAYDVGPFWSFLYGFSVYGIASDIPDWLDLRARHAQFRQDGVTDLVPFLCCVGDPNPWCFNSKGEIVHWWHEEPELREVEPMTFDELLMQEIHELEQRKIKKLRGE